MGANHSLLVGFITFYQPENASVLAIRYATDLHRFAPPEAGCLGGPPGTAIVGIRTNLSDPVCGIVVSGHRTIGKIILDAFVPLVTHRTLGISILHCLESLGAGEK